MMPTVAERIIEHHYAHSVPSGKSHHVEIEEAVFVFAIPANPNIATFLLGANHNVWELSRMWAPDGHAVTLTAALSQAVAEFRQKEPDVVALVSYADPNQGHEGGIYRAASWVYTGQSKESRYYEDNDGQVVARRKFHSGNVYLTKSEIESYGYREIKRPGKHRFAKGLTKSSRAALLRRFA